MPYRLAIPPYQGSEADSNGLQWAKGDPHALSAAPIFHPDPAKGRDAFDIMTFGFVGTVYFGADPIRQS